MLEIWLMFQICPAIDSKNSKQRAKFWASHRNQNFIHMVKVSLIKFDLVNLAERKCLLIDKLVETLEFAVADK